MPDLSERLVNVAGENAAAPAQPAPPLSAPPAQSISQQIVQNVTQLCPMPSITQPRDPIRLQQWAKPSIPQTPLHLPNVVKPTGNSLPTTAPTVAATPTPAGPTCSISANPTSVSSGGESTLTVVITNAKSTVLRGKAPNGGTFIVSGLTNTGGSVPSGSLSQKGSYSFTITASGAPGVPSSTQSCTVRVT
jgi:hypothetical protein